MIIELVCPPLPDSLRFELVVNCLMGNYYVYDYDASEKLGYEFHIYQTHEMFW